MMGPFIVARFVIFALLFQLNVLILIFSAWNINVSLAAGLSASTTSVFLVFNSCAVFFFIALGLADLALPKANTSHLALECVWSGVLSVMQISGAISSTIMIPDICVKNSSWSLCASAYLLVPTTWSSAIMAAIHCFMLVITAFTHASEHPHIWSEKVYSVPWFKDVECSGRREKFTQSTLEAWSRYVADVDASVQNPISSSPEQEKAPWAQAQNIRRGLDAPFKVQDGASSRPSPATSATLLSPTPPLRVQGTTAGSRFIEKFRESFMLSRPRSPLQPFPVSVENHDLPIPLPRLSEWVRADAIRGVNVHTVPRSPSP